MIDATARGAWRDLEDRLRPFIARRVRSSADVDDVMQEVFLRMQRGLPDLRDDERFGSWVYRIARNAIAEHHRVSARHPVAFASTSTEDGAEEIDAGDEREAHDAVLGCIAPFVATLPKPYREAITLAELEGLTQRAAAEMLGVTLPAMKSRVQRGRAQLREAIDSCCRIALDVRGHVILCEPRSRGRENRASEPKELPGHGSCGSLPGGGRR